MPRIVSSSVLFAPPWDRREPSTTRTSIVGSPGGVAAWSRSGQFATDACAARWRGSALCLGAGPSCGAGLCPWLPKRARRTPDGALDRTRSRCVSTARMGHGIRRLHTSLSQGSARSGGPRSARHVRIHARPRRRVSENPRARPSSSHRRRRRATRGSVCLLAGPARGATRRDGAGERLVRTRRAPARRRAARMRGTRLLASSRRRTAPEGGQL